MPLPRIKPSNTAAMVIDLQEKLLPHIDGGSQVESQAVRLIRGCAALDVPLWVTEQYPQGLGKTVASVQEAMGPAFEPVAKTRFSAWVDPLRASLGLSGRSMILLIGIESHVCVLQTAMDLAAAGYLPVVVADATGSRRKADFEGAMARISGFGLIGTVESILMEMVEDASKTAFSKILPLIK